MTPKFVTDPLAPVLATQGRRRCKSQTTRVSMLPIDLLFVCRVSKKEACVFNVRSIVEVFLLLSCHGLVLVVVHLKRQRQALSAAGFLHVGFWPGCRRNRSWPPTSPSLVSFIWDGWGYQWDGHARAKLVEKGRAAVAVPPVFEEGRLDVRSRRGDVFALLQAHGRQDLHSDTISSAVSQITWSTSSSAMACFLTVDIVFPAPFCKKLLPRAPAATLLSISSSYSSGVRRTWPTQRCHLKLGRVCTTIAGPATDLELEGGSLLTAWWRIRLITDLPVVNRGHLQPPASGLPLVVCWGSSPASSCSHLQRELAVGCHAD